MSADDKHLIIHHASCADGFCAAWLTRKALWQLPDTRLVDLWAAQYGDEPPWDLINRETQVWIVDFSYPRALLEQIEERARHLVVIDHHKTAAAELEDLPFCLFDMERSGAAMVQDYFHLAPHWVTCYVQDRDLWRWQLPHSREVSAAIRTWPYDLKAWDQQTARPLEEHISDGRAVLRFVNQVAGTIADGARMITFDGVRMLCVNVAATITSEVLEVLYRRSPSGASMGWFQREDGRVVYSLRAQADSVDVSAIAKKYGGGGHSGAAGFTLDTPILHPWLKDPAPRE